MTDEEAIKNLKKLKSYHNGSYGTTIDMAIKALEQQPCEDCVSREAIRNVLIRDNEMNGYSDRTHNLMEKLFDLPSVTPQVPILDKIRAEIKSKIVKRPWLDFKDMERDRNDAFLEVLDIINKYKAESRE